MILSYDFKNVQKLTDFSAAVIRGFRDLTLDLDKDSEVAKIVRDINYATENDLLPANANSMMKQSNKEVKALLADGNLTEEDGSHIVKACSLALFKRVNNEYVGTKDTGRELGAVNIINTIVKTDPKKFTTIVTKALDDTLLTFSQSNVMLSKRSSKIFKELFKTVISLEEKKDTPKISNMFNNLYINNQRNEKEARAIHRDYKKINRMLLG